MSVKIDLIELLKQNATNDYSNHKLILIVFFINGLIDCLVCKISDNSEKFRHNCWKLLSKQWPINHLSGDESTYCFQLFLNSY